MQIFQNSENPANAYFEITRTHFLLFVIAVPVMAWQSPGVVFNLSVYVKSRLLSWDKGCYQIWSGEILRLVSVFKPVYFDRAFPETKVFLPKPKLSIVDLLHCIFIKCQFFFVFCPFYRMSKKLCVGDAVPFLLLSHHFLKLSG
jgi:hypothetical protein